MVFPTVVAGPESAATGDPSVGGFTFPLPAGSYNANDVLAFIGSGSTTSPPSLEPGTNSGAFWVDSPSPWASPPPAPVFPIATRLHDGDSTPVEAAGDSMAGAGAIMAFRNAQVALAGFVQTNMSQGSGPFSVTVTPSFSEVTQTDRLYYLLVAGWRTTIAGSVITPRLAPLFTYSGIISSDWSWTEIADEPSGMWHLYEMDGGMPAGTDLDGTENLATYNMNRGGHGSSGSFYTDAVVMAASYYNPNPAPSLPVRKRQLRSQHFTPRRGPQASR